MRRARAVLLEKRALASSGRDADVCNGRPFSGEARADERNASATRCAVSASKSKEDGRCCSGCVPECDAEGERTDEGAHAGPGEWMDGDVASDDVEDEDDDVVLKDAMLSLQPRKKKKQQKEKKKKCVCRWLSRQWLCEDQLEEKCWEARDELS